MNSSGNIFGFYQVKHVIWMLTFMGGLYDAAGYFKLQGLFTSSVTGNLISACANIEYPDTNIAKTCVTVAFFVSAGLATVLSINFKLMVSNSNRKCTILLFSVYAVCLTVAWIVGAYLEDQISDARLLENQDDSSVVLVGSLMVNMHRCANPHKILIVL